MSMEIGTSDPGRPRTPEDVNALNNVLTPDMIKAGWVRLPGGGLVPPNVTNPRGWQADRDTVNVTKITQARQDMADAVTAYHVAVGRVMLGLGDMAELMTEAIKKADAMAEAWHKFAEATGDAS